VWLSRYVRLPVNGTTLLKRAFDAAASFVGLLVLAAPLALIALAVWFDSGRPVLFRQTRIGRQGKPFTMLKFRTMVRNAESAGRLSVGEDSRVTRVGRILRRYKLDEFPQLVNVLRGDMSLVGPRPEVPEYAFIYPEQSRVWSVRPGITDPTSLDLYDEDALLGRAEDPADFYVRELLPQKTNRYLEYVESRTFLGDIGIILRTLLRAVSSRGTG